METLDKIQDPDPYLILALKIAYTNTSLEGQERSLDLWYREIKEDHPDYRTTLVEETGWGIEEGPSNQQELKGQLALRENLPPPFLEMVAQTAISASRLLSKFRNDSFNHFQFFGNAGAYDPPFSKIMAGRVFSREQIELMENGLVEPVKAFGGGWCSRQFWQPVDPSWDQELRESLVETDEPRSVYVDEKETIEMVVFCAEGEKEELQQKVSQDFGWKPF